MDTDSLKQYIIEAAEEITPSDVTGYNTWRDTHRLPDTTEGETVIARQAALSLPLRIYTLSTAENIDFSNVVTPKSYTNAIEVVARTTDNVIPPTHIDYCCESLPTETFHELAGFNEELSAIHNYGLGELYESLIENEFRWPLGQFHTSKPLTKICAEITSDDITSVFTAGSGNANIVSQFLSTKPELSPRNIYGIDTSPIASLLGTANILSHPFNTMNMLPAFSVQDVFSLSQEDVTNIDVIVSNPPYTKHHQIPSSTKTEINQLLQRETGVSFSRQSPLYIYVTAYLLQIASPGTPLIFITPSEFLNTKYGKEWKQYVTDSHNINGFIQYDTGLNSQFDSAMTTTLISKITAHEQSSTDVRFTHVTNDTSIANISQTLTNSIEANESYDWGETRLTPQKNISPNINWSTFFHDTTLHEPHEKTVPLNELFRVSRGIATGSNEFFCLSESDRIGENNQWHVATKYLEPVIRSAQSVPHYQYSLDDWKQQKQAGKEVWLLYDLESLPWDGTLSNDETLNLQPSLSQFFNNTDSEDSTHPDDTATSTSYISRDEEQVIRYLKHGMKKENPIHKSYLASQRSPWYLIERRNPPPVVYTSFSRSLGRFIKNEANAYNLNNLHGLYPQRNFSTTELHAILGYLNSEYTHKILTHAGRELSSGLLKVEPNDLSSIPVLDPNKLSNDTIEQLATLFTELCTASRSDEKSIDAVQQNLTNIISPLL